MRRVFLRPDLETVFAAMASASFSRASLAFSEVASRKVTWRFNSANLGCSAETILGLSAGLRPTGDERSIDAAMIDGYPTSRSP